MYHAVQEYSVVGPCGAGPLTVGVQVPPGCWLHGIVTERE